jgi:uncharacterized protein (TIGR03435 family)
MTRGFVTAISLILGGLSVAGQSPLRFEVASVKPHAPGTATSRGGMCSGTNTTVAVTSIGAGGVPATSQSAGPAPGICQFRQVTVRTIVGAAYGMREGPAHKPVIGGPDWIDTELFDLDGKPDRPRPQQELQGMLQMLLADRFGLRVHRETRDVEGYALTVAPRGSKMARSQSFAGSILSIVGGMTTQGANVDRLAQSLEFRLGKRVVNDTGLTEVYAFTLRWTPGDDERPLIPGAPPDVQARMRSAVDPDGPSLFTALDEQLGLRLQPRKVPLEFLVVDAVQRPTPN